MVELDNVSWHMDHPRSYKTLAETLSSPLFQAKSLLDLMATMSVERSA